MTGRLAGKFALVTAAGQGIGHASAQLFANEGARVIATDINEAGLATLKGCETRRLDVTDGEAIKSLATELGALDVLFNCAGYVHNGTILECDEDAWNFSNEINVRAAYRMIKCFLPAMLENGGASIVNMSSVTGPLVSNPRGTIYSAAKAAIMGMTRAQAIELARYNITVNGIGPGWIETPSSSPEEVIAGRQAPIGRPGTADEIAEVALFLASEEASFVTGQLIVADGGNTLMEYKGPAEGYY